MKKSVFTIIMASVLLSGCASIVGSTSETISFNSNVVGAEAVIKNKHNATVYSGPLPMTLSLRKKAGFFREKRIGLLPVKTGMFPNHKHWIPIYPVGIGETFCSEDLSVC